MKMFKLKIPRSIIIASYTIAICLCVLLLPASFTVPFRTVFTQTLAPLEEVVFNASGDALAAAGTLRDSFLRQDNYRNLHREYVHLQNNLALAREKLTEYRQKLSSISKLNIEATNMYPASARIIAYDTVSSRASITLNAGEKDGVRRGMAVSSLGALIGTVEETGRWASRVRLITDPGSSLPCRVQRTRDLCILTGIGDNKCSVEWIGREASVKVGDLIVTSPLAPDSSTETTMPSGMPVARIVEVGADKSMPLFKHITARPLVDVSRLEYAEILIPERSTPGVYSHRTVDQ